MKEKSVTQIFKELDELIEEMERDLGYKLPEEPKETLSPEKEADYIRMFYEDLY